MSLAAESFKPRAVRLLTIGQVMNMLCDEFEGLTPSKLRFLEENQLITPQRTASGYRKYTELDIDRLRIILTLQRDRFLPHKVIRQYLEDLDAGKNPPLPGSSNVDAEAWRVASKTKFSELEIISATGITPALIAEASSVGLMGQEPFEASDMDVARSIMQLQRFGIQPRHLRGTKAAADREIGIVQGVVAPVLAKNDVSSRARAVHYSMEIANEFAAIHAALVRSALTKADQ